METWLMIVGAGLATFGTRALFSLLPKSWRLPPGVQALLAYVPIAVFSALAMSGLVPQGATVPDVSSGKVLASVVGAYVAWHTRNLGISLLAGMVVYWLAVWVD